MFPCWAMKWKMELAETFQKVFYWWFQRFQEVSRKSRCWYVAKVKVVVNAGSNPATICSIMKFGRNSSSTFVNFNAVILISSWMNLTKPNLRHSAEDTLGIILYFDPGRFDLGNRLRNLIVWMQLSPANLSNEFLLPRSDKKVTNVRIECQEYKLDKHWPKNKAVN